MNGDGEWRVTVDGGGETWPTLGPKVMRGIDELDPGDILHVISEELTTRCDIADWCWAAGHDLVMVRHDADATRFWIRKGRTNDDFVTDGADLNAENGNWT